MKTFTAVMFCLLVALMPILGDWINLAPDTSLQLPQAPITKETQVLDKEISDPELEPPYFPQVPLSDKLKHHIILECDKYGVPPVIVFALIKRETDYGRYNPKCDLSKDRYEGLGDSGNSYGIMQIQKHYYEKEMDLLGLTDLQDNFQNVTLGIYILRQRIKTFEAQYPTTALICGLLAYNRGESGAKKYIRIHGINEVSNDSYVKAILLEANRIISY